MALRRQVEALWSQDGAYAWMLRWLLLPFAVVYGLVVSLRNFLFDRGVFRSVDLGVPTLSVGNLVVGGTGKSVVVQALAEILVEAGQRPMILTRGYGSALRGNQWVALEQGKIIAGCHVAALPDEPRMISYDVPTAMVLIGRARSQAFFAFLQEWQGPKPTHVILDDGFQHRQIRRDVDLVLLEKPLTSNRSWLLPAGPGREPYSAVKRATAVMIPEGSQENSQDRENTKALGIEAGQLASALKITKGSLTPAPHCEHARWDPGLGSFLIVVGIARPSRFFTSLTELGIVWNDALIVGDHEQFKPRLFFDKAADKAAVITTAKDYWRSPELFAQLTIPTFILPVRAQLDRVFVERIFADMVKSRKSF